MRRGNNFAAPSTERTVIGRATIGGARLTGHCFLTASSGFKGICTIAFTNFRNKIVLARTLIRRDLPGDIEIIGIGRPRRWVPIYTSTRR